MPSVIMPSELTAENGAKALLSGEFTIPYRVANPDYCGCGDDDCDACLEEPEYFVENVAVPWDTIKEIYRFAVQKLGKPFSEPNHA